MRKLGLTVQNPSTRRALRARSTFRTRHPGSSSASVSCLWRGSTSLWACRATCRRRCSAHGSFWNDRDGISEPGLRARVWRRLAILAAQIRYSIPCWGCHSRKGIRAQHRRQVWGNNPSTTYCYPHFVGRSHS